MYLGPCQISMIEAFYENGLRQNAGNYFCKKLCH